MLFSEVGRQLDFVGDEEVAELAFFFVDGEAFAFEAHAGAVLGFGFQVEFHLAVEGVDGDFAAEDGGVEVDGRGRIEDVAFAFVDGVVADDEGDVEVACGTAVDACAALPGEADGLPVGDACGHGDAYFLAVHIEDLLVGDGGIAEGEVQLGVVVLSFEAARVSAGASAAGAEEAFEEVGESAVVAVEAAAESAAVR